MAENLYSTSWALYKAESESFSDDFDYYRELCSGKDTLELFAGYGRLTNYLKTFTSDLACVELEPNFASFIELPKEKINCCNVLDFKPSKKYERIIAGYNSFCLLTQDDKIKQFFQNLSNWLTPNGIASLSYYSYECWKPSIQKNITSNGNTYSHSSSYMPIDLSNNTAIWIDRYSELGFNAVMEYKYPVKVYKTQSELEKYLAHTDLNIIEVVSNYRQNNITDDGWVEYVFTKY